MSERPGWMAFYEDGTTFSSDDGRPWEAPRFGVICLVQDDSAGKWVFYIQEKMTVLCWGWRSPGEWVSCDMFGALDYFYNHPSPIAMLFGRWTTNENFEHIRRKADAVWRDLADGK